MKILKSSILFLMIIFIMSTVVSALDISDPEDDVDHVIKEPYSITPVSTKPNLDVTTVGYTVDDEIVTLTLSVKGAIEDDASITYYTEYECNDALYQFTYSNGNLNSQASAMVNGEKNLIGQAIDHTIDPANTITVTYSVIGMGGADGELYGYAGKDFPLGDEYWMDNTVVDFDNQQNDGGQNTNDNGGSDTPGFEMITVLVAFAAVFFLAFKRKY